MLSPAVVSLLPTLACADEPVERVAGRLDARTYPTLVELVARNLDKVVAVDVRIAADGKALVASSDGHGTAIFVAKGDTEIYVPQNAGVRRDPPRIEGVYTVRNGGINQGIVAYALESVPGAKAPAGGAAVRTTELK